jgi:hypothetical protein
MRLGRARRKRAQRLRALGPRAVGLPAVRTAAVPPERRADMGAAVNPVRQNPEAAVHMESTANRKRKAAARQAALVMRVAAAAVGAAAAVPQPDLPVDRVHRAAAPETRASRSHRINASFTSLATAIAT